MSGFRQKWDEQEKSRVKRPTRKNRCVGAPRFVLEFMVRATRLATNPMEHGNAKSER